MMSDITVVLIGADGQLGTEWTYFLNKHDIPFKPYTIATLDITDYEAVRSILDKDQPQFVINASAYTQVDRAESENEVVFSVNADAVANMSKSCEKRGITLVHYSTDYVFAGTSEDQKKYPDGYPEDAPADPINVYGLSKWKGEEAMRKTGGNHLVLRISWLCGAFGNNFVKTMIRLGKERPELRVVGDQYGSPSFTPNVVANSWLLMQKGKTGTWNITSDGFLSWYDLACETLRLNNIQIPVHSIPTEAFPTPAPRPRFSKLCIEKLKTVDGAIIEDWKAGLAKLVDALDDPIENE